MPTEECPFKAGDTVRSQMTNTTYTIEKIFWSNSQGQWEVHLVGHTPVSDEDMEYLKALLAQSVAGTW